LFQEGDLGSSANFGGVLKMKVEIDTTVDSYELWKKVKQLVEYDYKTRRISK